MSFLQSPALVLARSGVGAAGGSENGKPELIELLARQLSNQGLGITHIDPH